MSPLPTMRSFPQLLVFFLFVVVSLFAVSGCSATQPFGIPVALAQTGASDQPKWVMAQADTAATPTPFQPIPPTAVFFPTNTPLPTATPTPIPTPTPEPLPAPKGGWFQQPRGQMNVLLLGSDQRPGDPMFRTDTIILATINTEFTTVNLTSFPRDLWVTIPGWGESRINTAWGHGGFETLAATFETNFGVRPDHYVMINFRSFKKAIDSLGGLEIEVGQPLGDYRSGYWVNIPKGRVYMDADDILWYVRSRKTSNDFARSRRQQEVLRAVFEKMLGMDAIRRIPEFYDLYKDNVTTDIGMGEILPLLPMAARIKDSSHLQNFYIGPEQTYDFITWDGAMVLMPRPEMIEKVMRKALNVP